MQEGDRTAPAQPVPEKRQDRSTVIKVIVALVLLILLIIFVAQNSEAVTVDFVFGDAEVGLIWVFLACALIGALIGYLLGRPGRQASRKYIKELERRVAESERRKD
jgi:lipopolysaccharide assembly protein A